MAQKRIEVAEIPCARSFPEIERELGLIGGKTPTGENRLKLEWGGTAKRPFGTQLNCKFGLYSEDIIIGWHFHGDASRAKKRDRIDRQTDIVDLNLIPPSIKCFSDGTNRIAVPIEAIIDHPIPNWFVTDWLAPEQVGFGPYRHGYWNKIWRIYDAKRDEYPFWGYRDPDEHDLVVVREYWHTRTHAMLDMGLGLDEPITGDAKQIQDRWMDRAVLHLKEEQHGNVVEKAAKIAWDWLQSQYASIGKKPFVQIGDIHGK